MNEKFDYKKAETDFIIYWHTTLPKIEWVNWSEFGNWLFEEVDREQECLCEACIERNAEYRSVIKRQRIWDYVFDSTFEAKPKKVIRE